MDLTDNMPELQNALRGFAEGVKKHKRRESMINQHFLQ